MNKNLFLFLRTISIISIKKVKSYLMATDEKRITLISTTKRNYDRPFFVDRFINTIMGMDGQIDEWMDEQTDEQTDWMDGQTDGLTYLN